MNYALKLKQITLADMKSKLTKLMLWLNNVCKCLGQPICSKISTSNCHMSVGGKQGWS